MTSTGDFDIPENHESLPGHDPAECIWCLMRQAGPAPQPGGSPAGPGLRPPGRQHDETRLLPGSLAGPRTLIGRTRIGMGAVAIVVAIAVFFDGQAGYSIALLLFGITFITDGSRVGLAPFNRTRRRNERAAKHTDWRTLSRRREVIRGIICLAIFVMAVGAGVAGGIIFAGDDQPPFPAASGAAMVVSALVSLYRLSVILFKD
ncbi:hypothetical protein JNJ66_05585 [Candidatus Saccharibacteria bacterium]|nr:hypothetical protein [Candidatus Saccharibacteria bacterium]